MVRVAEPKNWLLRPDRARRVRCQQTNASSRWHLSSALCHDIAVWIQMRSQVAATHQLFQPFRVFINPRSLPVPFPYQLHLDTYPISQILNRVEMHSAAFTWDARVGSNALAGCRSSSPPLSAPRHAIQRRRCMCDNCSPLKLHHHPLTPCMLTPHVVPFGPFPQGCFSGAGPGLGAQQRTRAPEGTSQELRQQRQRHPPAAPAHAATQSGGSQSLAPCMHPSRPPPHACILCAPVLWSAPALTPNLPALYPSMAASELV